MTDSTTAPRAPHEVPNSGHAAEWAERLRQSLPRIETDRLLLRAPTIEDFQAYAEIAAGPGGRFLMDEPSREEAWYDFTQMCATWLLRGHGLWSVTRREDDAVLGFVVLGFEPGDHEPELGYMFREVAHGRGFAREAAIAAREYAFGVLGMTTLVSTIDPDNEPSIRLAERLGAHRDRDAERAHNDEILVYRHQPPAG